MYCKVRYKALLYGNLTLYSLLRSGGEGKNAQVGAAPREQLQENNAHSSTIPQRCIAITLPAGDVAHLLKSGKVYFLQLPEFPRLKPQLRILMPHYSLIKLILSFRREVMIYI